MTPTETAAILRQFNVWRRGADVPQPKPREIGEVIDAAVEMIDRLEAAEKDVAMKEEVIDSLAAVVKRLDAQCDAAEKERDAAELMSLALRAKIEAMEKQKPYSYIYEYANPIDGSPVWRDTPGYWNAQHPKSSKPLYALPGAQTQGEEK